MKTNKVKLFAAAALIFTASPLFAASFNYPDPNRFAGKIDEFRQWDCKNAYPQNAVLFVGSSSIVGWKTAEAFSNLPVINRGFGGSLAADLLHFARHVIIKYKPAVVVIYEGDNDIAKSIPPEQIHKDFVRLFETVRSALPATRIICLAAKISPSRLNWQKEYRLLNCLNHDYAESADNIIFVDTAAALMASDGLPDPAFYLPDRLHLNEEGYARWNALLAPVIEEAFKKAKETPPPQKDLQM